LLLRLMVWRWLLLLVALSWIQCVGSNGSIDVKESMFSKKVNLR
jgi:hypothetical protein